MRNRLIGSQLQHLPELPDRQILVAIVLVINPQIEPGMRQRRIVRLHFLQNRNRLIRLARNQQRQRIIQLFTV